MLEDMAAKGAFPIKVDSNLRGIANVLRSVACEWLLLFLLLLDAAFSYFLTKFAEYCELQVPCILCSRLDHVFGKEKPDFYRNLLCSDHKSELSSLTLCHNHGKLADVHEMCEECILSFAKKDPNQELHKLLVGKLRLDCLQQPFLSMDSHMRSCSCCSKQWRSRPNLQKLVQSKLPGHVSKPDIPLPKSPVHKSLNRQEGLKKRKDHLSPLVAGRMDYNKEKANSDSESDFPFSDDDDMIKVPRNMKYGRDDYRSYLGSKSPKRHYDEIYPIGLLHRTPDASILMHSDDEPEKGETTTPTCMGSNSDGRDFFAETNLQQIYTKPSPALPEIVPLDDVPLSSNAPEISPIDSTDEGAKVSVSKTFGSSGFPDHSSHSNGSISTNMQLPVGLPKENFVDTKENGDVEHAYVVNNWESIDLDSTSTVIGKGTDDISKGVASTPNSSAFDDLASGTNKQVEASALLPEQIARRDCNGIGSNEGPIASKTSSLGNKNSTLNGHADGHTSVPMEYSVPSKSPKMERSLSRESLEESVGENGGDNLVDKLRQELEHSKKCIENLQKELEEERNASTIAANQAMAMITKLQEEKAALNMESLQYLRMMEEQAEYDMEALERANDLIAEKEKEMQDLEAELDYFRIKYPEDFPEGSDILEESGDIDELKLETIDFES